MKYICPHCDKEVSHVRAYQKAEVELRANISGGDPFPFDWDSTDVEFEGPIVAVVCPECGKEIPAEHPIFQAVLALEEELP